MIRMVERTEETLVMDWLSRTPLDPHGRHPGPAGRHPASSDAAYLRRRDDLVAAAEGHRVGVPSPTVEYTETEHATWRTVHAALVEAHREHACRAVLRAWERAAIPGDRIPQHEEVSDRLQELTGFRFTLAGGIVPNKRFLGAMADGYFHAVQYVRHPAMPLYAPEPDVLHDVFSHGTHLCDPWFADLYRAVGRAAARVESRDALDLISRLYWFTLEFGVAWEDGRPKAYGAALLSSYGELGHFQRARILPLDIAELLRRPVQIAGYQPVLYAIDPLPRLADFLHGFLDGFDDDTRARLRLPALHERGSMARPDPTNGPDADSGGARRGMPAKGLL
ncbi:phenylalanine 4-monooxygenase [Streptomyces sp. IMTB 2501]|uniref:phenylalanine 4-monooxygenase n=1 Tax=Streptomyces sp. IMTB 2501 TaxID=1776340 RepID=UPI00096C7F61|nr:phenylalanine 4-monooxygenase [Streptomyces sp. IMTB 2501]OLZ74342.1 phenylalanine 4-monooxygenase [Streptomyces sp. IMTB 2501]